MFVAEHAPEPELEPESDSDGEEEEEKELIRNAISPSESGYWPPTMQETAQIYKF